MGNLIRSTFNRNWMGRQMADSLRFSIKIRAHNSRSHISPALIFLISSGYDIHDELQKLVCAQIGAKLRRAHSSLSSDTIIGRSEETNMARPRKLNFHSVSRRRWWTAKRDHVAREDKEALLYEKSDGNWERRGRRLARMPGVPLGVELQRRLPYIRRTRIITAQVGYPPFLFRYNRLKCIHSLIMRRH